MKTTIETNNETQSEQVDKYIEKRSVGKPKKYFNDDRKEAIRKQQLATKRRYAQKK
ncbi:MAG: hypothetical protein EZS28_039218, partial [Streblomastix strix]